MTDLTAELTPFRTKKLLLCHGTVSVFKNQPEALSSLSASWSPFLFNTPQHVRYQAQHHSIFTFILSNNGQTELWAFFHLFIENQNGISPRRGPFGSFELKADLGGETLTCFVQEIEQLMAHLSLKFLKIKSFPACYDFPKAALIEQVLQQNGFVVSSQLANQHLAVSEQPFEATLHPSEKRRLRKCRRAGFSFEEWQNPEPAVVYDFIEQNRRALGYALTFDLVSFVEWLAQFPENYLVFCVKDQAKIVALTLAVRVSERVLYNFCPADCLHYRTFSPTVLLNQGLYAYCQQNHFEILDLGVSVNAEGEPKTGLIRFKRNLGAVESSKLSFFKKMDSPG